MADRRLRRNDIVMQLRTGGYFTPYGRVVRRVSDTQVDVIFVTKDVRTLRDDELEVHNDYRGRWETYGDLRGTHPLWIPMPTLRRLKQMASVYDGTVWRRARQSRSDRWRQERIDEALHAPWTPRQVELINEFQRRGQWSSEECPHAYQEDTQEAHLAYFRDHPDGTARGRGSLVATTQGFHCPVCSYTQTWTPRYALLGDFHKDR